MAAPTALQHLALLPSTAALIQKKKRRKAPGYAAVTAHMLKAAPRATARRGHPPLVKTALTTQEPLLEKYGNAAPLRIGQGPIAKAAFYRSTTLVSEIPKLHHTVLRANLTDQPQ